MGFEVLDSQDWVGSGPLDRGPDAPMPAAVDIVQLDERSVNEPSRKQHSIGRGAAMVIVSLTVAAVLGGYVASRHQEERQQQAAEAAFAASAALSGLSVAKGNGRTAVNLTATVTNHGPRSITVITTPEGAAFGNRVSVVGSTSDVVSGASSQVRVHLHVDCDQPGEHTSDLTVRTADRREHQLPLGKNLGAMVLLQACRSPDGNSLRPRS